MVTAEDTGVTKNYTISVNRANAPDANLTYYITVADVAGGSANVTVDKITAKENETVNVTITDIETGKQFSSLSITGENGSVSTTEVTPQINYSFRMPSENVTVEVTLNTIQTTTPAAAGASGGGGGGGGGGATGEEFENIEFKDVSSIFVGMDMSVRFEFRNDDSDIRYIAYDSLKNAGTISATIEALKDRSSFADTLPEGIIYRNINIWVGKTGYATPENIEGPVIGFRVPESWIDANAIDVDSIVLNRYDGRWSRLPTLQTGSDNSYLYFEASTPGFSPFAITGESLDENIRLESAPDILNSPVDEIAPQTNTSILNDTMPDKTLNSISGITCILILFIACFLRRKQ
jgi:PGF-pre-PGF domain-containing protein